MNTDFSTYTTDSPLYGPGFDVELEGESAS